MNSDNYGDSELAIFYNLTECCAYGDQAIDILKNIMQYCGVEFTNIIDMYLWFRLKSEWVKDTKKWMYEQVYDIASWFAGFYPFTKSKQTINSIKYIQRKKEEPNKVIIHLTDDLNLEHVSLMDIHKALKNNYDDVTMCNGHIEILYNLNNKPFAFVFPIYVPRALDTNLIIKQDDAKVFPIHPDSELNTSDIEMGYEYANFKLVDGKTCEVIEYELPEILKTYSGPNHDFYYDKQLITLTDDFQLIDVKYKLHKDLIDVQIHPNINKDYHILSIEALRSDNYDLEVDNNNVIIK